MAGEWLLVLLVFSPLEHSEYSALTSTVRNVSPLIAYFDSILPNLFFFYEQKGDGGRSGRGKRVVVDFIQVTYNCYMFKYCNLIVQPDAVSHITEILPRLTDYIFMVLFALTTLSSSGVSWLEFSLHFM